AASARVVAVRECDRRHVFFVVLNNSFNFVVDSGELDFDDNDDQAFTREIDVPWPILNDGLNEVDIHFSGNGGHVASVAITIGRQTDLGPEVVLPNQVAVESGELVNGTVAELEDSDDQYFEIRSEIPATDPALSILVDGSSSILQPSDLRFVIESSTNTPNVEQSIEAYNWTTETFDSVSAGSVSISDSMVEVDLSANVSDYINQTSGAVQVKLEYQPTGPVLLSPWAVRIDQANWSAEN
ncbi:MAG: hypothetical protein AAGA30_21195, partial [Planctomycetota bacterium]